MDIWSTVHGEKASCRKCSFDAITLGFVLTLISVCRWCQTSIWCLYHVLCYHAFCEMKWHDIMTWDMFLASQWSPQAKISKAMHSAVIGSLHAMILVTLRMEPLPEVVRHDSDGDIDWPLADVLKHWIQLAIDQRVNVIFERFTPRRLLLRRLCWNNLADLSVEILND